jgi:hypothetical protein
VGSIVLEWEVLESDQRQFFRHPFHIPNMRQGISLRHRFAGTPFLEVWQAEKE